MKSKSKPKAKRGSARPGVLVLLALVLSAPTLSNLLAGSESTVDAGVHLGGAVVVAWMAVTVVGHLFDSYRAASLRRDAGGNGPGRSH